MLYYCCRESIRPDPNRRAAEGRKIMTTQEQWEKNGYQVITDDDGGRCRFCGAKMNIETDTETERTWKHPEPVEDERCDREQVLIR